MAYNLAQLDAQQKNRINIELSAAAVAFKERYAMPVNPELILQSLPEDARPWFQQRLDDFRELSKQLSRLPWEPKNK
jgi:DNA polymerase III subunit theta